MKQEIKSDLATIVRDAGRHKELLAVIRHYLIATRELYLHEHMEIDMYRIDRPGEPNPLFEHESLAACIRWALEQPVKELTGNAWHYNFVKSVEKGEARSDGNAFWIDVKYRIWIDDSAAVQQHPGEEFVVKIRTNGEWIEVEEKTMVAQPKGDNGSRPGTTLPVVLVPQIEHQESPSVAPGILGIIAIIAVIIVIFTSGWSAGLLAIVFWVLGLGTFSTLDD